MMSAMKRSVTILHYRKSGTMTTSCCCAIRNKSCRSCCGYCCWTMSGSFRSSPKTFRCYALQCCETRWRQCCGCVIQNCCHEIRCCCHEIRCCCHERQNCRQNSCVMRLKALCCGLPSVRKRWNVKVHVQRLRRKCCCVRHLKDGLPSRCGTMRCAMLLHGQRMRLPDGRPVPLSWSWTE